MPDAKTQPAFPPPLSEHVCRTIYAANLAIQRIHKVLLDELGITYLQYWDCENQSVSELAGQLELEASTLTPLLKRLEAGGYVSRVRNPEDERQVMIGLTDKGRELRGSAGCVSANLARRSGMSASELHALNAKIRELHDRLVAPVNDGDT